MANIIDQFTGFVNKYGDEALAVARALDAILEGLALLPDERAKVKATIDQLEKAHDNITGSKPPSKITIRKVDIQEAVKAELPALIASVVDARLEPLENAVAELNKLVADMKGESDAS